MDKLTTKATAALEALRSSAFEVHGGRDGRQWGTVHVHTMAMPEGMTSRGLRGCIGTLTQAGLYEPQAGTGFGFVVMGAA